MDHGFRISIGLRMYIVIPYFAEKVLYVLLALLQVK